MKRLISMLPLVILCAAGLAARPQTGNADQSMSDRIMSPAVVVSWMASRQPDTGATHLDLMVLWRGQPGWYVKGRTQGSSGGGASNAKVWTQSIEYGTVSHTIQFDPASRVARLDRQDVKLGDDNVVLVDDADRRGNVKIVGTKKVDADMPNPRGIEIVIRKAPELHPFLRCDAKMPDPALQPVADAGCSQIK